MAVPDGGVTRWFRDSNGKISQINNVVEITFATPLIANGTFRDSPPVVVGGAAGVSSGGVSVSIAGGVSPSVSGGFTDSITGASSVAQDDNYAHVDLRFAYSPVPLVFFRTTDDLIADNPTVASFSNVRPPSRTPAQATFDVFDVDCVFSWGEDCAIFNTAPPGWSVGESS